MIIDLLAVAGLTILIMISPGPDFALVTRNTVVGGKHAGGWTSAGILTGNLVHVTYCLLGIGWIISTSIVAFTILKIAGGAYLIFLGLQSFRSNAAASGDIETNKIHPGKWWRQGFLNNILNPKGPLFYLGVFAVYVNPESTNTEQGLLVATTIGVSAGFWLLFVYVLQISSVRDRLLKAGRWINRILGAALIALGIRLWFSGTTD